MKKAYQAWQAGNRQLNAEYLEFERMRKHYAGRENEMPYKTLAGFRQARRAQSKEYLDNRRTWINRVYPNNKKSLTNNVFSGRIEERPSGNYYEIAKNGGKHSGKYKDFRTKQNVARLNKSIKSLTKTINEHAEKISSPAKYCIAWNEKSKLEQEGLLNKWHKDLQRNKELLAVAIGVLEEKKDE